MVWGSWKENSHGPGPSCSSPSRLFLKGVTLKGKEKGAEGLQLMGKGILPLACIVPGP